jgi:hypothetical protein
MAINIGALKRAGVKPTQFINFNVICCGLYVNAFITGIQQIGSCDRVLNCDRVTFDRA